MAAAAEAAPEEGFSLDSLTGLAGMWEGSQEIRGDFREKKTLLTWPNAVGVPSMILGAL